MITVNFGTAAVATAVTILAPSLAMPPFSYLRADHEAGDVLQKDERDAALGAQLDEMRALQRALREQDAVIGEDADRVAPDPRKAADQGRAVEPLELVELAAVDDAGDDLAHVVGPAHIGRDDRRRSPRPDRAARAAPRRRAALSSPELRLPTMRRAMPSAWRSSSA